MLVNFKLAFDIEHMTSVQIRYGFQTSREVFVKVSLQGALLKVISSGGLAVYQVCITERSHAQTTACLSAAISIT